MKAYVKIDLITISCPICGQIIIDEKSGSTMTNPEDYDKTHKYKCDYCNQAFNLPKKIDLA